MPDSPTTSDLNVNRLITELVKGYANEEYLADQIMPGIKVKKTRGSFGTYDKSRLRVDADARAYVSSPKERAKQWRYSVSTDTYVLQLHRAGGGVDIFEKNDADSPFDPVQDLVDGLAEQIKMEKEVEFVNLIMGSGNYATGNKTVSTGKKWSNYVTATGASGPLFQVFSAANRVRGLVGRSPQALVVGAATHMVLVRHPDVTDSVKYVELMTVMNASKAMAALFGVDTYKVHTGIKVTTKFGETDTISDIVGDKAALMILDNTPRKLVTRFGVQFQHFLFPNGDSWTDPARMNTQEIEARDCFTFKSTDTSAGYLFADTNA